MDAGRSLEEDRKNKKKRRTIKKIKFSFLNLRIVSGNFRVFSFTNSYYFLFLVLNRFRRTPVRPKQKKVTVESRKN